LVKVRGRARRGFDMDFSKLPKLSQTPAPPADQPNANPAAADAPVVTPQAVELFCRCGAPIVAGTKFCAHCGASYREVLRGEGGGAAREIDGPEIGTGAEAWLSLAMGAILIFVAPNIWKYYLTPGSFTATFTDAQGNPMPYRDTAFYWADLGLASFVIVMFLEALVILLARKATLVLVAFVLTAAATVLNIYVLSRTYSLIGFQLFNAFAAAFGVYIALYEWAVYRSLKAGRN
jgi:hypothetical protein